MRLLTIALMAAVLAGCGAPDRTPNAQLVGLSFAELWETTENGEFVIEYTLCTMAAIESRLSMDPPAELVADSVQYACRSIREEWLDFFVSNGVSPEEAENELQQFYGRSKSAIVGVVQDRWAEMGR